MKVLIIGPELSSKGRGNRITSLRWGNILAAFGNEVRFANEYDGDDCDLLIALHAIWSAPSLRTFRNAYPDRPIIVALTGTDIYGPGFTSDANGRARARESMAVASALVVFHPLALDEVPEASRAKARVISQSVRPPTELPSKREDVFEVCVVGELRDVKDPFRTALAARQLPPESSVRVLHAGAAGERATARAIKEERVNARYNWLGEMSHNETLGLIGRSRLMAITSRHEGGPNALTEALGLGTPVVATRIPGTVGILGEGYPGYFEVEDTQALGELLRRAETDATFYDLLLAGCRSRSELASPAREVEAWKELLASI